MLALVDQPSNETATMPAPEDLTVQTPGEPIAPAASEQPAANDPVPPPADEHLEPTAKPADSALVLGGPAYSAKHNGGGRWKIWYAPTEGTAGWFGDFVGDKTSAEAEAERMNAGGEPYVAATAPVVKRDQEAAAKPAANAVGPGAIDPVTLKQPVLTSEGWLCPEPPAAKV